MYLAAILMTKMSKFAMSNSRRFYAAALVFIIVYPLLIFPQHLLSTNGVFIFDGELIHLIPRLLVLMVIVLLGWRFWRADSPFPILLTIYLGFVVIGSLNSRDPDGWTYSVIGPARRMDGLLYQALLVGLAITMFQVVRLNLNLTAILVWVVLVSSAVQAGLIWLQRLGIDLVGPTVIGQPSAIMFGTLGHPGVAAGFLLVGVLLAPHLYFITKPGKSAYFILAIVMFCAVALGFTENRASAFAATFILVISVLHQFNIAKLFLHSLIVLSIFLPQAFMPNMRGIERDYADTYTLQTRWEIWKLSLEALHHIPGAPIIGGGPDALNLALLRGIPPEKYFEFLKLEEGWPSNAIISAVLPIPKPNGKLRETTYKIEFERYGEATNYVLEKDIILNKSHNMLLERLVSYGLISLVIWLVIYLYPVWVGIRSNDPILQAFSWALSGLFIYYIAWFPTVQVEPIHIIVIATAWALITRNMKL